MTNSKKTLSLVSLGLAAALLGPITYAAAEEVVVVHDHPSHHERVRERRAEERAAERARIREHERAEHEREVHDRHHHETVIVRP